MENDISVAKSELYRTLRNYNEVLGASVRSSNGDKYIVILLSELTSRIKPRIPAHFKGNRVISEVLGKIKAL
jgi:hypothetical protein